MTAVPLERLASADSLLVGCDFDGTVSEIVDRPEDARPVAGALAALSGLAALPRTHVALLSGRSRDVLRHLVGPIDGVALIGGHGAEWDEAAAPDADRDALLARITERAREIVESVPGAMVEVKPNSVAVHVRLAARQAAEAVLAAVDAGPAREPGVKVITGKEVVELSVADADKGTALRRLIMRHEPSATLYLGDDVTDEAAFAALPPTGIGVKVGTGETRAGFRVADPSAVTTLLTDLVTARSATR